MKQKLLYTLLCFGWMLAGCDEDPVGQQPLDGIAPMPPTNVTVENLNGAAMIRYDVPKDEDLMYVKASYVINGKPMEVRSSVYTNELKVVGFGDTLQYDVTLTSVDRSRNESESVQVKVRPLLSPVQLIFNSLKMFDGFGGVGLTWENPTEAEIMVTFMVRDSTNVKEWIEAKEPLPTSVRDGNAALRGYDTIPIPFAVYIRDRWDNYSDTLIETHTPLFEQELNKEKFEEVPADKVNDTPRGGFYLRNLWDGKIDGNSGFWHTNAVLEMPVTGTIDLGTNAKLSRFKYWQRPLFFYTHNNPRRFALYGCLDINDMDPEGGLDTWTLLGNFESFQPSGQGPGKVSNEDNEFAAAGEDFEFPIDVAVTRYVRIVVYETWGGSNIAQGSEIKFWGQEVK